MWRVRCSRALARRLLGKPEMLSAWAHWRGHWSERWLDRAFFFHRQHCRRAADFEAQQARGAPGFIDNLRRRGLL